MERRADIVMRSIFSLKMWTSVELNCFSSIVLIVVFCSINAATNENKPIIKVNRNAEKNIIVSKHDDIIITCEADEPIRWTDAWTEFPSLWTAPFAWNFVESELFLLAAKLNETKYNLYNNPNDDTIENENLNAYQYKVHLSLRDVDYKSVGLYFCVKNSSTFSQPIELYIEDISNSNVNKSNSIYLSVKDNDFPIKSTHDIWKWDTCKFDGPCIPTVHNETIRFNNFNKERALLQKATIYRATYDKLANKNDIQFTCTKDNDSHAQLNVHVDVDKSYSCDERTMITFKTDDFAIEGSTLELKCIYIDIVNRIFKWEFPSIETENRADWNNKTGDLTIRNVNKAQDIGVYTCIVTNAYGNERKATRNITRILAANETFLNLNTPPEFNSNISMNVSDEFILVVKYSAYPKPNFTWYDSNNKSIDWIEKKDDTLRKVAHHDREKKVVVMIVRNLTINDSGIYTLIADNGKKINKDFRLEVRDNRGPRVLVWVIFGCGMICLSLLVMFGCYHNYRAQQLKQRIKKGELIGTGITGDVHKGEIMPISLGLPCATFGKEIKVVIKTHKHNYSGLSELMKEIHIVRQLPPHPHIVRYLGSVTGDPLNDECEIMIVYELCAYGNMRCFLAKNSDFFVNQVECADEYIINYRKTKPDPPTNSGNPENQQRTYRRNTNANVNIGVDSPESQINSTLTPSGKTFSTIDIYAWSVQMADGLTFLASKNIFHRDLAARNILIYEDMSVKIGDFGIAKEVREGYEYTQSNLTPKPYRWMAMELRRDEDPEESTEIKFDYSPMACQKCDVWSFGVIIWELFSLGKTPELYSFEELKDGKRLKHDETTTTQRMYNVMHDLCWAENPNDRPTFAELKEILLKFHSNAQKGIDGDEDDENDAEYESNLINVGASTTSPDEKIDASDMSSGYDSAHSPSTSPCFLLPSTSNTFFEIPSNSYPIINPFIINAPSTTVNIPNEIESNQVKETRL
ncbi:vascular endothelial growth factor receptor 1-like [Sitodiplosis mosellana]|uniref:vascular endothelial growth factor receptor 1-like n=1 Tax=Sitodiplosis mosellana TaxID=263140 RepID=UPI002443DDCF|nr:vascular endothelial growth factor receptor 1-like [Sitodiplosis mosellana]XP_055296480.1 vascular endothelial growth factor receptor 1-like [Sitodiplosis mosellana]XP_055296481.1 vascular endothelial growth factor receptor 1-like [Sitodiplosis mosellana]